MSTLVLKQHNILRLVVEAGAISSLFNHDLSDCNIAGMKPVNNYGYNYHHPNIEFNYSYQKNLITLEPELYKDPTVIAISLSVLQEIMALPVFKDIALTNIYEHIVKSPTIQGGELYKLKAILASLPFEDFFEFSIKQSYMKGITPDKWFALTDKLGVTDKILHIISPKMEFLHYLKFEHMRHRSNWEITCPVHRTLTPYFERMYHVLYTLKVADAPEPFIQAVNKHHVSLRLLVETDVLNVLSRYLNANASIYHLFIMCIDGCPLDLSIFPVNVIEAVKNAKSVSIFVRYLEITPGTVEFLSKFTNIDTLGLYSRRLQVPPPELGRLTNIKRLVLGTSPLAAGTLKEVIVDCADPCAVICEMGDFVIDSLGNIEELTLEGYNLKSLTVQNSPNLKMLTFIGTKIGHLNINRLNSLTTLSFFTEAPLKLSGDQVAMISNLRLDNIGREVTFIDAMRDLSALVLNNTPSRNIKPANMPLLTYLDVTIDNPAFFDSTFWQQVGESKTIETLYVALDTYESEIPFYIKNMASLRKLALTRRRTPNNKKGFIRSVLSLPVTLFYMITSSDFELPAQLDTFELTDPEYQIGALSKIPPCWFRKTPRLRAFVNGQPCRISIDSKGTHMVHSQDSGEYPTCKLGF